MLVGRFATAISTTTLSLCARSGVPASSRDPKSASHSAHNVQSRQRILEARGSPLGVAHGVLDVAMAEVRLQDARVGALVGKLKATGVPEHVWGRPDPRTRARRSPAGRPRDLRGLTPQAAAPAPLRARTHSVPSRSLSSPSSVKTNIHPIRRRFLNGARARWAPAGSSALPPRCEGGPRRKALRHPARRPRIRQTLQ